MLVGLSFSVFFFFNDTATTEIYTLSLHDALPIYLVREFSLGRHDGLSGAPMWSDTFKKVEQGLAQGPLCWVEVRSEEHTSELQSHLNLVCRLLLEKKKIRRYSTPQ